MAALTPEQVMARAVAAVGADDFGSGDFREGLERAQYGLTADRIRDVFSDYMTRFDL